MRNTSTLLNKKLRSISLNEPEELIKPHKNDKDINSGTLWRMEDKVCQLWMSYKNAHSQLNLF